MAYADSSYQYDIMSCLDAVWDGRGTMEDYLARLNQQEVIYPDNYIKMRYLENHDIRRFAAV